MWSPTMDLVLWLELDEKQKAAMSSLSDEEILAVGNEVAAFAKYGREGANTLVFVKHERDHRLRVYVDRSKNVELICRVSTEFGNMRKLKTYMENVKFDAELFARGIVEAATTKQQAAKSRNGHARPESGPGPMIA